MQKAFLKSLVLLIPLVLFYVVEKYWGLNWGAVVAVAASVVEVVVLFIKNHSFDTFSIINLVLISVMAGISLYLHSDLFIKLKPALFEFFFVILFFGSSFLKRPFLLMMMEKQTGIKVRNILQKKILTGINFRMGIVFLIHGLITLYAAFYTSTGMWLFVKGILFYLIFAIYIALEWLYIRFYLSKKYASKPKIRKDRITSKL